VFNRFATPVDVPSETTPINILIDLDDVLEEFVGNQGRRLNVKYEDACVEIRELRKPIGQYRHSFTLVIDETEREILIRWDSKKRKYWLQCTSLSYIQSRNNERITLVHHLNQRQSFRIITADSRTAYAFGRFYAIDLQLSRPGGSGETILGLLYGLALLRDIKSEKGSPKGKAAGWPSGSLFHAIDRNLVGGKQGGQFGQSFAALVCDDLNDETADFIAIDGGAEAVDGRIAQIHAKWKKGSPGVSAAHLYDVCGQAVKNLSFLKIDSQDLPGTGQKWNNPWKLKTAAIKRIRSGPDTGAKFRDLFRAVRVRPSTRREVWLVLGGAVLSRKALMREFASTPIKAHVLQAYHLLLSTYAQCLSIGVDLRIFCAD
jgi:hypothetical protein